MIHLFVGAVGSVDRSLSASIRLSPLLFHPLAKGVRLANGLKNVGLVREPVQQCSRQAFVAKDLYPVGKAEIHVDDRGDSFVQGRVKLQDQLRTGSRERDES